MPPKFQYVRLNAIKRKKKIQIDLFLLIIGVFLLS